MEKLSQPCPIFFALSASDAILEAGSNMHRSCIGSNSPGKEEEEEEKEEAFESFVLPRRSGTSVTSALPRGTFDKIFRNRVPVIILWLSSPASVYPTLANCYQHCRTAVVERISPRPR